MKSKPLLLLFLIVNSWGVVQSNEPTPFMAGAAKIDVTPSPENLPKGYYGIHDKLFCRAVVIENKNTSAALITVDQGMVSSSSYQKWTQDIEKETGIPATNIFVSASHTHSAPWNNSNLDSGVIGAVKQAREKLQPARIGYNTGLSYLNINRDVIDPETRLWTQGPNYEGPSDKTVAVIKFESTNDELIAVYYNYAMHANTMFMSGRISADFPGEASKYVEEYFDNNIIALFSSGAAGDQNPISIKPMTDVARKKTDALIASGKAKDLSEAIMLAGFRGESDVEIDANVLARQAQMISSMGQLLGEEIIRIVMLPQRTESVIGIFSAQETITCPGRRRTNTGREGAPGTYEAGDPVNIKLSLLRIGDIALCGVNAEVYNIIGQRLKNESPLSKTILATITNGAANSGYVPSDDAFQRYTFQVLGSRLQPNCAERSIINGLLDLIEESENWDSSVPAN